MVEHRTENSGVRGSNPFIGIVKKLLYIKNIKKLLKLSLAAYAEQRLSALSIYSTRKYLIRTINAPIFPLLPKSLIKRDTIAICRLNPLNVDLTGASLKNFYKDPVSRRSSLHKKLSYRGDMLTNLALVFPLLALPRGKSYPGTYFNALSSVWWYKFYLQAVAQQFLQFKSEWMLLDCSSLATRGYYGIIFRALYKKHILRNFFCKKPKFIHWCIKLTVFKDLSVFVKMLLRWLMLSTLRKHRRVFVLINQFLRAWYTALYEYNKIRGYCIFFKGKLGRKGSVRKTKYFAKKGEVSYSTKSLKLSYRTFHFSTITGVVGGGVSLFY